MRAFIVGNGPSLKDTPLNKLKNEACFAVNRIHLVYDKTEWRPTHYVRAESMQDIQSEYWKDEVLLHLENTECWLNPWFYKKLGLDTRGYPNAHAIAGCPHYLNDYDDDTAPIKWHLPALCTFGSSLHVAIQIAVKQGYGPLYLVGCDLGYTPTQENSHMHKDYTKGYKEHKRDGRIATMNMIAAHIQAKKSSPVPIYNATIGGNLEVYERVNLCDIL